MRSETAPIEMAFLQFAAWCDKTPECALYGKDTKKVYGDLRKRAKAGKLLDPDGRKVSFYSLASTAFGAGQPGAWGQVAASLADLNDGAGVAQSFSAELENNSYPPIWCSDWQFQIPDYAEYKELRSRLDREFPNVQWTPYVDHAMTCVGSGTKTTNPQRHLEIDNAPPLVMVGNVHDPATVYEWNRTAARQSHSHLITYEGYGHTAYGLDGPSDCVNKAVDEYLINLKIPARGLRCPATEIPGAASTLGKNSRPLVGPYAMN
jgi:hypothetical protein